MARLSTALALVAGFAAAAQGRSELVVLSDAVAFANGNSQAACASLTLQAAHHGHQCGELVVDGPEAVTRIAGNLTVDGTLTAGGAAASCGARRPRR